MECPRCHSTNVTTQVVNETVEKRRGCLGWIWWIIWTVLIGWIILLIGLITNTKRKTKQHTVAVCQACGHTWNV